MVFREDVVEGDGRADIERDSVQIVENAMHSWESQGIHSSSLE